MEAVVDLHTHSVFSDGTYSPTRLVREAKQRGLSAIALTDHNTVAGLPEFLRAGREAGVETVPGVEFSTDYRDMDLHVVALFVMPEVFPRVTDLMEEGVRAKEQSNRDLIEKLRCAGMPLDYEAIRSATPNGQVNRAHLAAAMQKAGYVCSIQDAFRRYLEPKFGLYTAPKRPDTFTMIRFIRSIGAVPVLAHPFLKLDEPGLRALLDRAVPAGLLGMETLYATFDGPTTALAVSVAEEYGLAQSGGSDFHGANKPDLQLGVGRGSLAVPYAFLDRLKALRG